MGDRRIAWFFVGFVIAVLFSAGLGSAHAQTTAGGAGQSGGASGATTGRPDLTGSEQDDYAAPGVPRPISENDPSEPTVIDEDGFPRVPRIGQRTVPVDGDLDTEVDQTILRDGIIDDAEPLPPQDGDDPMMVDTRAADDIDIFENPPAGFDPLLFQIEDLDPIRDNRATARLFLQEPFDPIGIRIGSFVLFPEVEFATAWTSNVFLSPDARADTSGEFRPQMRLVSNWSNHALEFSAAGDLSEHSTFDTENNRGYTLETRGRLDVTRRTNLQGLLSRQVTQESRSSLDASSVGTRATVTTDRAEATINHRFNRLSVQLRGSVSDFDFGDTENLGVVTPNDDRNYTEYEETVRAGWEFKPSFSVFGEVAVNQREYDQPAQSDSLDRSSNGERYRVGVSFGNSGQVLRGEIALGYGIQRPDEPALRAIDGLIIDANATWRMSELTSVLFTARSDVTETTTANVAGAFSRTAGVEVRHAFRRHLVGSAGLTYSTQDSQDGVIDEQQWQAALGLEYFVNREVILFGRYAYTDFDAVGTLSDYTANDLRVGVRVRR